MAYLGRISAVLTANTRDFTRQIGTARRELQGFASQARGIQLNLDNRALNGTLTNLQRFRRTLQEIQRLQAAGVGAGLPNTRRLNDQFRAFEDLGRPLTDVKNRIEGLSNAIQAELYPELEKIQAGFRNLYRDIDNGSTTFERSAARIDNLRQRLIGLSRATAALSDLNSLTRQLNANNSGASFFAPRAQEALQRSLALRGQAQSLPARFRENPAFADLAVQAEENAERVERAAARVARANAEIEQYGANPNRLARRGRAQTELDAATRQQANINLGLQREVASAQIQQIVAPDAPRQADRLIERVRSLTAELRAIDGNRFNGLIASTAAIVDQFNRGETSANRARAAVDRLAQSLAAAGRVQAGRDIGRDLQEQADRLLFTERQRRQRTIQSAFDTATANVPAGDPRRRRAELERDITLRRDQLVSEAIPRTQGLFGRAGETGDQQAIRDAGTILRLNRQINAELNRGANFTRDNNYAAAAASLQRVNDLLRQQQQLERGVADRIEISNTARRQTQLFLDASGGTAEQLSQGARDAAADISTARQFRGQIASGAARIQIQAEIDRTTASVQRLQQEIAEVAASGIGAGRMAAELDRLDNEIRQTTQGLARFIAVRSNGAFSENQISAAMERARNTAGSITTRGAAVTQLAVQQALFAIDDLISATGGLEYKLRAVGNNITQLGLLLGQSGVIPGLSATTGLMVGLGVVIGGQVISALLRYVTQAQEATEASKALGKAIEKTSSIIGQISQGYAQIGDSVAAAGFSSAARAANEFADALQKVADSQRKLNEEQLLFADDATLAARRRQERIAAESESFSSPGSVIAAQRLRAENTRIEQGRASELSQLRAPTGQEVRRSLEQLAASLRATQSTITGIVGTADALASGNMQSSALLGFPQRGTVLTATATRAESLAGSLPLGRGASDVAAQAAAIDDLIERLKGVATQRVFGFETTAAQAASRAIADLSSQLVRLQGEGGLISYFKEVEVASKSLSEAQTLASAAIDASMPDAVAVRTSADALAEEIKESQKKIRQANERLEQLGAGRSNSDIEARNRVVETERRRIRQRQQDRDFLLSEARRIDAERIIDPQRLLDSRRARSEANLQASGLESGATARRIRELEARRSRARAELESRPDSVFVQRRAARELDAVNQEMAAIEATTMALKRFTEAIARAEQEARSNLEAARQREEDVRRQSLAPGRGAAVRPAADVQQAERDLEEQRRANQRVEDEASRARIRLEREAADPNNPLAATFRRLREIEELAQAGQLTSDLIEERRRLERRVDQAAQEDPNVRAARDDSTRIAERQAAEQRGRELALTDAQRARRDAARQAADIQASFERDIGIGRRGVLDVAGRNAALNRLARDQLQQIAPALAGFREERLNAALQGPSRAALNVADAQTMEGQRELNRLLRGDDPAREANLVELQKQSELLQGVIDAINEQAGADVVEIRG